MTGNGPPSLSGDDSALPDDERALLERARALIPRLAERASAATAARQLPPETIAEYHQAGILRVLQPRRFGGLQGRFSLFSRIVEELTFGCASSAWVYAVLAEHQWIIAQYPERAQIEVWGNDPLAVASSSLAPRAVFVPEHRCVMVSDLFAGTPPGAAVHPDYPVVRAPRGFLVSYSLPPVAIALARRALEIVCRDLSTRLSRGVTKMADSEVVQMAVGEAAAAIDAATLALHHGRDASTDAVSSGRKIGEAEALRARRDMVY